MHSMQIVVIGDDGLKQEVSEFNPEFIAHLLPKLDWVALRQTASEVREGDNWVRLLSYRTVLRRTTSFCSSPNAVGYRRAAIGTA